MSAEKLISTMEKLLQLHKSLYEIALKKTEIVKIGDIQALNLTMKDEQAHIAAISKLEKERQKVASDMIPDKDNPTMEDCLKMLPSGPREVLTCLRLELIETISEIKKRNDLNQQMIYQSLQFVNFSLNLILPQRGSFNYGPKAGKTNPTGNFTGIINSQA